MDFGWFQRFEATFPETGCLLGQNIKIFTWSKVYQVEKPWVTIRPRELLILSPFSSFSCYQKDSWLFLFKPNHKPGFSHPKPLLKVFVDLFYYGLLCFWLENLIYHQGSSCQSSKAPNCLKFPEPPFLGSFSHFKSCSTLPGHRIQ